MTLSVIDMVQARKFALCKTRGIYLFSMTKHELFVQREKILSLCIFHVRESMFRLGLKVYYEFQIAMIPSYY